MCVCCDRQQSSISINNVIEQYNAMCVDDDDVGTEF